MTREEMIKECVTPFVKVLEREMPYDICDGQEAISVIYQIAKAFNR